MNLYLLVKAFPKVIQTKFVTKFDAVVDYYLANSNPENARAI